MPNFDGTGPLGKGSGTGKGRGKCKSSRNPRKNMGITAIDLKTQTTQVKKIIKDNRMED